MRIEQGKRQKRTGVREDMLHIDLDPLFADSVTALNKAMEKSEAAGVGVQKRNTSDHLTDSEVQLILNRQEHSIRSPMGLLKRTVFHCLTAFGIRGGQELHDLLICQFQISKNQVLKKKCVM